MFKVGQIISSTIGNHTQFGYIEQKEDTLVIESSGKEYKSIHKFVLSHHKKRELYTIPNEHVKDWHKVFYS
jgi:hypothetical protein